MESRRIGSVVTNVAKIPCQHCILILARMLPKPPIHVSNGSSSIIILLLELPKEWIQRERPSDTLLRYSVRVQLELITLKTIATVYTDIRRMNIAGKTQSIVSFSTCC
jgi:hypothetical protein